ncbi:MAG: hypothetical protein IKL57_01705 [Oscillospiraceae bacterium]|nr:hypothetical protein [Oscillospiraceae bacterium]
MDNKKSLRGIGLLSLEIMHLISIGKKETFDEIEKHFEEKDLVEYLYEKYNDKFVTSFDSGVYDNEAINTYFFNFSGCIEGEELRKYEIAGHENGLLLILALIAEKVEIESDHWYI